MDIGEMNFDDAGARSLDRIVQSDGRMGKSTGIQNDWLAGAARLLDPGHEFALMVCLTKMQVYFTSPADRGEVGLDIGQRVAAVDFRLARAEQVEIWPV